jgi:rare lipoprotein A
MKSSEKRQLIKASFLFSLLMLLVLSGCAPRLISTVHKHRVGPGKQKNSAAISSSSKKVPKKARIPATQRPYKIKGKIYYPIPSAYGFEEIGIASWYGKLFHGRKTSNGEIYDMYSLTAAHKTLPMGTYLLVENLKTNKQVTVKVNDRGPFVKGRIIDLTFTAAKDIGIIKNGTGKVKITALGEAVTYQQGKEKIKRFKTQQDFETGEFYVQIGAFGDINNARRLKKKMSDWGKKAIIKKYNHGDKIFHRVQVRAGSNLTAAKREERVLAGAGYPDAFVVAK